MIRSWRTARIVVALTCSVQVLVACQVTLASAYDDTFDQELTAAQKDIGGLFSKIGDNPNPGNPELTAERYSNDTGDLAKIHSDLDTLRVRAAAHTVDDSDTKAVAAFQDMFAQFEKSYQTPVDETEYSFAHMRDVQSRLDHALSVMMSMQLLKKAGQPSSGAGK